MNMDTRYSVPEKDVRGAVEAFFHRRGFRLVSSFRIRTWRPDVVAVKGPTVVVVETKGSAGDLGLALAQTAVHAHDASEAYLAVPGDRIPPELFEVARVLGVGLLALDEGRIRVRVRPRPGRPRPALVRRLHRALASPELAPAVRSRPVRTIPNLLVHRHLVERLLVSPGRRFTIRELARASGTPYATAWRVVSGLVETGVLEDERVGPSRAVSVNPGSPLLPELRKALALELSPHRQAARLFAEGLSEVPNVRRVVIFGSVARGEERPGSDVDVAVVLERQGRAAKVAILAQASAVQERLGITLVPLCTTEREIRRNRGLAQALKGGEVLRART